MKRLLAVTGALVLLAWTGLGLVAWSRVASPASATFEAAESTAGRAPGLAALADELAALRADVRALAGALGDNLEMLREELATSQSEHAAALGRELVALREEVGSHSVRFPLPDGPADLTRETWTERGDEAASAGSDPAARPVPPEPDGSASAAEPELASARGAARPRGSFLAFSLPSDDFRFDERRKWSVLPALSRVGFDAKTTLHDFSGVTSELAGEMEVDLAHPADDPHLCVRVEASGLATGDGARDEAMREHLATAAHPALEFELVRIVPGEIVAEQQRGAGRVHGRMTIRGVTREVEMDVRYSIDEARRLCVEGEMPLDLTQFDVPVPSKLGLITMKDVVQVWVSLRLRPEPRSRG